MASILVACPYLL